MNQNSLKDFKTKAEKIEYIDNLSFEELLEEAKQQGILKKVIRNESRTDKEL